MRTYLNGIWQMKSDFLEDWIDAEVPGSVYKDLLANQLMDDPFYRDNEKHALKLMEHDYVYRRYFNVDQAMLGRTNYLVCEGLDTLATIYINGKEVAKTDNMHRTYRFLINDFLKEGENEIQIHFASCLRYIREKEEACPYNFYASHDSVRGYHHLRKVHSMFGWDWGPQLPDAGIWRDIYIDSTRVGYIEDVFVKQSHRDDVVDIQLEIRLELLKNRPDSQLEVMFQDPNDVPLFEKKLAAKEIEQINFRIDHPELWWPRGYGKQPLYQLVIRLYDEEKVTEERVLRIGLRTIVIKREKDKYGESFIFVVNGVEVFVKGANYIPEDSLVSRISKERTERLLWDIALANHNIIRVWGGGYYPPNHFYDLCDELGILVWQDLMFACSVYNMEDKPLVETMVEEVKDNIKRIRHHASLALICGNNENETMIAHWNIPEQEISKKFYIDQFEVLLPQVVKEVFPEANYWKSSPSSGGGFFKPNDDNFGDMHYWGVWHNNEPITYYRKYYPRLMSEFGLQSFPHLKTIETFTEPSDRNVFSYIMEWHQKNGTANEKIINYISKMYRFPKDFDSLIYLSQLIQAEGIRYGVEHWRRHYGRCMGAIYWQLNDCWPGASWSSIDYSGRWKALHYHSKKFYADVLLSLCETDDDVSIHLTNDTLATYTGMVLWKLIDFNGKVLEEGKIPVDLAPQSAVEIMKKKFELSFEEKMHTAFYAAFIVDGAILSENLANFLPDKYLELPKTKITYEIKDLDDCYELSLSSAGLCKFVEINFRDFDYILSDNYFFLLPGEKRAVTFKKDQPIHVIQEQVQIRSLVDSYE